MKKMGYLGSAGSNSHRVAETMGVDEELVGFSQFTLGRALAEGTIDHAVLPVENSSDGDVGWVLNILKKLNSGYYLIGEANLQVKWVLAGFGELGQVCEVVSHPQGLLQCGRYVGVKNFKAREVDDTTVGVKLVAERCEVGLATICAERAAERYGIPVIAKDIGDHNDGNITRFIEVGRDVTPRSGCDKTSIVFETANKHGALRRVIDVLDINYLNMTYISSKPVGGELGKYVFFIDFEGHEQDRGPARALYQLQEKDPSTNEGIVAWLRVLGSYPRAGSLIVG